MVRLAPADRTGLTPKTRIAGAGARVNRARRPEQGDAATLETGDETEMAGRSEGNAKAQKVDAAALAQIHWDAWIICRSGISIV
jgi:hypothetical protein